MPTVVHLTGVDSVALGNIVYDSVARHRSGAIFVGCAYISTYGADFLLRLRRDTTINSVTLISDIRDVVTHPNALALALQEGWPTRVVNRRSGTFHPKVLVLSEEHRQDKPHSPQALICGSNNLSRAGLLTNIEVGVLVQGEVMDEISRLARRMWRLGEPLTEELLLEYERSFRERNSRRSLVDLQALGVSDETVPTAGPTITLPAPRQAPSVSSTVSEAAWAGLESFTGEYTFQLEFPRDAARVLARLANARSGGRYVQIMCSDGVARSMRFAFYEDNDMFRLNIPNDVPGVNRARSRRRGIGLVERVTGSNPPLHLTMSDDAQFVRQIQGRSFALGTWGRTSTRLYGWY